ncbi:MAG: methyltransferase domain-containing protein [Gemmatimonadetes bacterium]|nr:methyltransferase domain-containing protein [Gemmatimonadota bacterium]
MTDEQLAEVRDFWNGIASDWQIQVGDDGDANRRLNSDPVLWDFAGSVEGRDVLDAGCGTGYLSRKLAERGARVVGIDLSDEMIEIARSRGPEIDFRVDSITVLHSVGDEEFDLVVANYVLMDVPHLQEAVDAIYRVLRPAGRTVVVFSHPCFPQGERTDGADGEAIFTWTRSYFEPLRIVEPPWGHFTSDFIWFHRPLSDYWKAFSAAGFAVTRFEEPRITPDRYHLATSDRELERSRARPYSVAFELQK